jgi:hypothetical protein
MFLKWKVKENCHWLLINIKYEKNIEKWNSFPRLPTLNNSILIILLFRNWTYHRIIFTCPIGQVGCCFHLPEDAFHLPRAIGQPLMSGQIFSCHHFISLWFGILTWFLVWECIIMWKKVFRAFGFMAPKTLNYFVFQSFDFEHTWWRLFPKCVLHTKIDIYKWPNGLGWLTKVRNNFHGLLSNGTIVIRLT